MLLNLLLLSLVSCVLGGLSTDSDLKGRFLTISDLHPDRFYEPHSRISQACHSVHHLKDSDKDRAGYWGSPISNCDSPDSLIDATFHELQSKWTDKLDFVIAMGDFARHDIEFVRLSFTIFVTSISSALPRSLEEIFALNQNMTSRLQDSFPGVPIVPSIGNNDVFPHNIMQGGPSKVLSGLANIWADFIPEEQYHTFARGGYYSREVIPNKLVVVALNTIFWFDSNKLLDGCPVTKRHSQPDPGTEQLDWLSVSLGRWRASGIQVILSGHVPPGDYYADCYSRFAELTLAYQDTIVASIFGHKNVDHFLYFSHSQLFYSADGPADEEQVEIQSAESLPGELKASYADIPHKANADDFIFLNIAPSIVPTYLPGYRIWTYNTSQSSVYKPEVDDRLALESLVSHTSAEVKQHHLALRSLTRDPFRGGIFEELVKHRKKKRKGKKRRKRKAHRIPRHVSPDSPSRSNKFLTVLGYSQYVLDLDQSNKHDGYGHSPKNGIRPFPSFEVEYTTYQPNAGSLSERTVKNTADQTPYGMPDLTIQSWVDLANQLSSNHKMWQGFAKRIFAGAL